MTAPYKPLTIANNFIELACCSGGVEHMKLQKLVYYAYGWWLGHYGLDDVRLTNEGPQIWKHGPVFASLYEELKTFGRTPITKPQSLTPFLMAELIDHRDSDALHLVKWVWDRYGHLSSYALSDMTHRPGTSWYRTAEENDFTVPYNCVISDDYIYEEFSSLSRDEQVIKPERADYDNREKITA